MNWNILVTIGKEINRDSVSSDERKWKSQFLLRNINKSKEGKQSPIFNIKNKKSSKTIKKLFEDWGT